MLIIFQPLLLGKCTQARVDILLRGSSVILSLEYHCAHESTMTFDDFIRAFPAANPVTLQLCIVELLVDGRYRFGVRAMVPSPPGMSLPSALPENLQLPSPYIRTDDPNDWVKLLDFAKTANVSKNKKIQDAAAAGECAASTPTKGLSVSGQGSDAGDEDASREVVLATESVKQIEFPRGRLGTTVRRSFDKFVGFLLALTKADWRSAIKEASLRGALRTAAASKLELATSEFPQLADVNDEIVSALIAMVDLILADTRYKKEEQTSNLMRFRQPIMDLSEALLKHQPAASLDAELLVFKVLPSMSPVPSCISWTFFYLLLSPLLPGDSGGGSGLSLS